MHSGPDLGRSSPTYTNTTIDEVSDVKNYTFCLYDSLRRVCVTKSSISVTRSPHPALSPGAL